MILMPHVTRLAKSDEIIPDVCGLCAVKEPERFDVVDGKALPDMDATIGTVSGLILHDSSARDKPTSSAIGPRPAHPIWGRGASRFGSAAASYRTKARNPILLGLPRLLLECSPAMFAREGKTIAPPRVRATPDILGLEGIGGAKARAKLIADQVSLGGSIQERFGLPTGPARSTAKAHPRSPVGLDKKGRLAGLACLFYHGERIPRLRFVGNGTILIACRRVEEATRQPDLFIAPPEAPTQETLL